MGKFSGMCINNYNPNPYWLEFIFFSNTSSSNRKNSITSINSAQMSLINQFHQQQTPNMQRQQSSGSQNSNTNLFNLTYNTNTNNVQPNQIPPFNINNNNNTSSSSNNNNNNGKFLLALFSYIIGYYCEYMFRRILIFS